MRIIMVLYMCGVQAATVSAQHAYWQQQVNYTIDVTLNDTEHTLDGFEKIGYTNNSPDTLRFIWFHLWPNAFKNDKTAFSEQMLLNGRTDFYFSNKEEKGYINRLDFKVNGVTAALQDHPRHIDIGKLILPQPLAPGDTISITTSFHVKLPNNFSRGGHVKQAYQVTQWYPKPAVYDRNGWHPMPYLQQGEFYAEFGNYDVRITLPANYVVAATGELQNADEKNWLKQKTGGQLAGLPSMAARPQSVYPASSSQTKSLRYLQQNVHDFAWFADKRFLVGFDTVKLRSGRTVDLYSYYLPSGASYWKNSISFMKDAITTRSEWLGEYPFNVVSAVEAEMGLKGGMEYPTITCISQVRSEKDFDITLAHEIGHNWFYGILASNERLNPWMDEGMSTYYDARYADAKYKNTKPKTTFIGTRTPEDLGRLMLETITALKKDQPVNSSAETFNHVNYQLVAYYKAGQWMKKLEEYVGRDMFESGMHAYFNHWQFKHPYPEDFKKGIEAITGKNLDVLFDELAKKGNLLPVPPQKTVQPAFLFSLKETFSKNYFSVAPAAGANVYDGLMVGALIHNYQLPLNRFQFFLAPLYALRSKRFNGIARVSYSWFPDNFLYRIDAGAGGARFTIDEYQPEGMEKLFFGFEKLAPFIRLTFKEPPLSTLEKYIQWKSYFIREQEPAFSTVIIGNDTSEAVHTVSRQRTLNQLKIVIGNSRVLYPYKAEFQVEQQKDFIRTTLTGRYYFNYANRQGGMNVRLFAGKFAYTGAKTQSKQFETDRYHLNMTGADGFEDYTYSNYFIGRNRFEGIGSQQIMMRDGGFKVRTNLLSSKTGKTDNWLIAANAATDVPGSINPLQVLPINIPLKVFADIGTYAEAWRQDAGTNRFLFDAGFQLSLFRETVNIYVPVIYSTVYRDYFRSTLGEKRFLKTISFSIDVQDFHVRKLMKDLPF